MKHSRSRSGALCYEAKGGMLLDVINESKQEMPSPSSSNNIYTKEGWLKRRNGYLKKWKKTYVRIEKNKYLCLYQTANDELINCTEMIDLTECVLIYTLDKPKEFKIDSIKNNDSTQYYFKCDSGLQANKWLAILQQISHKNMKNTTTIFNDLDFIPQTNANRNLMDSNIITTKQMVPYIAICDENDIKDPTFDDNHGNGIKSTKLDCFLGTTLNFDVNITDTEINELYMRAVSLYQLEHYKECERITKDVLRVNPNHIEAVQLYEYLVSRKYESKNGDKKKYSKGIMQRFKSVEVNQTGNSQPKHRKFKSNDDLKKAEKWRRNNNDPKEINDEKEEETVSMNPCQIEFKRFITERIQLNKYYDDLCERFEIAKYDDIRFLKDFDAEILGDEIGLRPLHIKCFLRKIEIFLDEIKLFQQWLQQIVTKQKLKGKFNNITCDGLMDLFENNGITTFEALYRYIESKDDLKGILFGDIVCNVLWNEIQIIEEKRPRRISLKISPRHYNEGYMDNNEETQLIH